MRETDFVRLDERLSTIAEMVPDGASIADIGCDHGYLAAYLLQRNRIRCAQLCDISAPSLQKARNLVAELHIEDRVTFSVGDGAQAMTGPADCVVIAGMGSTTITHIIEDGRNMLGSAILLLQANIDVPELRRFLMEHDYRIIKEKIAKAGGRHYIVLAAEPGDAAYSEEELLCGPILLKERSPLLSSYANFRLKVANKALNGAEKSDKVQEDKLRWEISIWNQLL